MQIKWVDAQHDEEGEGTGVGREGVTLKRLAEQEDGEHRRGTH